MFLFNLLCLDKLTPTKWTLAGALVALLPLRGVFHGQWYAQARDARDSQYTPRREEVRLNRSIPIRAPCGRTASAEVVLSGNSAGVLLKSGQNVQNEGDATPAGPRPRAMGI